MSQRPNPSSGRRTRASCRPPWTFPSSNSVARSADLARVELQGLMLKSILVLAEALEDPSPAIRLRAACSTLYVGLKTHDLKDVRERLDRLDNVLLIKKNRS